MNQKKTIDLPESALVHVSRVKFVIVCNNGHEYVVTVLPSGEMPIGWQDCLKCKYENNRELTGRQT